MSSKSINEEAIDWKTIFDKYDNDRNGHIDSTEFAFLVKDLLFVRDNKVFTFEDSVTVARRIAQHSAWTTNANDDDHGGGGGGGGASSSLLGCVEWTGAGLTKLLFSSDDLRDHRSSITRWSHLSDMQQTDTAGWIQVHHLSLSVSLSLPH